MIKLTIIVPVYNASKTLSKCIDSILAQTMTDLECILVDDGSLDDSREICDDYKRKDNRIVVIHQKNKGVSAARNAALDIARGEWIGLVDSDDWIEEQMFQFLLENATKKQADISICAFYEVYGEHRVIYPNKCPDMIFDNDGAVLELLDIESFGGYSWNKLTKAELFKGIRYDPSIKTMSDVLVFYEIFKRAKRIVYSPKPYYNYVQNPDSIVHKQGLTKRATGLSIWDKMLTVETNETIRKKIIMRKIEYASRICYEEVNNYRDDLYTVFSEFSRENIFYILTRLPISLKSRLSRIFCLIFPHLYILVQKKYRTLFRNKNEIK